MHKEIWVRRERDRPDFEELEKWAGFHLADSQTIKKSKEKNLRTIYFNFWEKTTDQVPRGSELVVIAQNLERSYKTVFVKCEMKKSARFSVMHAIA